MHRCSTASVHFVMFDNVNCVFLAFFSLLSYTRAYVKNIEDGNNAHKDKGFSPGAENAGE